MCQIWLWSDGRVEKRGGGVQTDRQTDRQREAAALYNRIKHNTNIIIQITNVLFASKTRHEREEAITSGMSQKQPSYVITALQRSALSVLLLPFPSYSPMSAPGLVHHLSYLTTRVGKRSRVQVMPPLPVKRLLLGL